jgi:ribosomal protein S18 acetylase RimI-like enzyme
MENKALKAAKKAVSDAGLYIVPKDRFDVLEEIAANAYHNYPLHNWLGSGKYDEIMSKLIMKITLKTMKNNAVIYADSEEMNGFAVWLPPGFTGSKTIPFLLNGGIRLILHSGIKIIGRLLTYENYAMKLKKESTGNKDWYLYNLSVLQKEQGKGIAKKLLSPMIKFCDNENKVIFLETNKENNVIIYQHFDFEVAKQGIVPKSNVEHYAMVRKNK